MISYFINIIRFKDLLINLTRNELKLKYKNSILGFLWSFIYPIMMLTIYNIAFKEILKMKIENFVVFVFIGLLPWGFVQSSISQSTNSIINNQGLIKKVYFPRIIVPVSIVSANFINLLINMIILFAALILFKIKISIVTLFVIIPLIITFFLVSGISFFLSSITVKYRDISYIVDVIFMAWFYLTPIIYSTDMIPDKYKSLIYANPLTTIIELYRIILLENKIPELYSIVVPLLYSVTILILGLWFFYKRENKIGEEL